MCFQVHNDKACEWWARSQQVQNSRWRHSLLLYRWTQQCQVSSQKLRFCHPLWLPAHILFWRNCFFPAHRSVWNVFQLWKLMYNFKIALNFFIDLQGWQNIKNILKWAKKCAKYKQKIKLSHKISTINHCNRGEKNW